MPTLLEKRPDYSAGPLPASDLLRLRHRWERWRGVLFIVLIGLASTFAALGIFHLCWQTPENGKIGAGIWTGGVLLTIMAALVGWYFAPSSVLDTAQQMDRALTAKNRLEATAALHGSTSLLAQAQREETTAYLSRQTTGIRPDRALPWLLAGVLLLVTAHLATLTLWLIPMLQQHPHPAPVPPPPPVKELPKASIVWQSPVPEDEANPIEEVPTVAIAESTSGLKDLSLEISVDGVPKLSTPLPATPFDKPGKNTLKTSLYMDELGVEPFDVVSYFIKARRITDQKVTDTTSAIQFIQVRPFRDDVEQRRGGESLEKSHGLLIRLKLAQLRSIKENFILVHTDLPVTDPVRVQENDRVGKNEGELSAKTEEVVQSFMQDGISPDIIDLLRQAEPPMADASKKILAVQNAAALPPQEKALSLIVEVEKFFHKVMADKGSAPSGNDPDDPFKDKQQHELKKRMAMTAGQLETLARNEAKLSEDLSRPDAADTANPAPGSTDAAAPAPPAQDNSPGSGGTNPDGSPKEIPLPPTQAGDPFGPDADKGTPAARQARILQGIETLLNGNKVLPPGVDEAMQQAQKDATTSMQELDQANNADAREPAASAAQDLQRAVGEMLKAGDRDTKIAMEAGQQKLNDLSQQLRDLAKEGPSDASQRLADMTRQLRDAKKQLEDAADKQQESGSASGAQRLNQLARAIVDQKIIPDLAGMAQTGLDVPKAEMDAGKLDALASQAAQGALMGKPDAHDIANLIDSLERSRANLARLAQKAGVSLPTPSAQGAPAPGQNQPGQGQGMTPSPGQGQGQGKGQGQGMSPSSGQSPGQGQGQGEGQGQGTSPGQGRGQGQGTGSGDGSGGMAQGNAPGSSGSATASNPNPDPNSPPSPAVLNQGYHDVMAELRDEAQLTHAMIPNANATPLLQAVTIGGQGDAHHPSALLAGGFQGIATPLDQLISELKEALALAQRNEVVKQPDLDDAPPTYRSAVSDYFEAMSKKFHPDSAKPNPPKP